MPAKIFAVNEQAFALGREAVVGGRPPAPERLSPRPGGCGGGPLESASAPPPIRQPGGGA